MSEADDRISNLPASLLHHILSFVDTRDAARTSVLCKRWNYTWRSVPTLEFQCLDLSQADKFMDFIDRTLEFHDESSIQKFSLVTQGYLNEPRIGKWITSVISHNVEELCLGLDERDLVLIPSSLYSCESLVKLTLCISGPCISPSICFPKYMSFPRLVKLMLFGVEFRDECWNEQLFSDCPVLELLILGDCTLSDMKSFCISNPALKNLVFCNPEVEEDGFRNCALKIHAPSLEVFIYEGRVAKDYVLSSFPALVHAQVDFFFEEYGAMSEQEIDDYGAAVSKFLRALAHVGNLRISDRTLQVLSIPDDLLNNLPSFHNLLRLSCTEKVTADKALMAFLETAPNLVSLKFKEFAPLFPGEDEADGDESGDDGGEDDHNNEDEGDSSEGEDDHNNEDEGDSSEGEDNNGNDGWALDMVATRCSFQHLKLVLFEKFTGNTREMRWLALILKNAKALQGITFSCDSISYGKSKNLMEYISSLPRASARCGFKFSCKQG